MGLGYPSISTNNLLKDFTSSEVSWIASVTAITMIIGGLFSGYSCDKFGRKGTLIYTDIIAVASFLIISFARGKFLFYQLIFARVLIGFHVGMSTTAAVMYIAEICDAKVRGRLSMLSSPFFTAFGMVVIYFLGAVVTVSDFLQLDIKFNA
jgi:MFS family permease